MKYEQTTYVMELQKHHRHLLFIVEFWPDLNGMLSIISGVNEKISSKQDDSIILWESYDSYYMFNIEINI